MAREKLSRSAAPCCRCLIDVGGLRRFCQIALGCALVCLTADAAAHGGVSVEDDTCVMQLGPYRAHFTGYQPARRASQEFCEDIPELGGAIIVLDFLDASLRAMEVDFRVVRNVTGKGVSATWEDIGAEAGVAQTLVHSVPAAVYPRGSFSVELDFPQGGDFIGIVTALDPGSNREFRSVFPFAVGRTDWTTGWGWVSAAVIFGLGLAVFSGRRRSAKPEGSLSG